MDFDERFFSQFDDQDNETPAMTAGQIEAQRWAAIQAAWDQFEADKKAANTLFFSDDQRRTALLRAAQARLQSAKAAAEAQYPRRQRIAPSPETLWSA